MKVGVLLIVLLLSPVVVGATEPITQLGGNYNGDLVDINAGLIQKSEVTWIRAFVNIPENFLQFTCDSPSSSPIGLNCPVSGVLLSNTSGPASDGLAPSAIGKLIDATAVKVGGGSVKLILSLKTDFKYKNTGVPARRSQTQYWLSAIQQLLEYNHLGQYLDILVVGNEPMFETPLDDDSVARYEAFLDRLIEKAETLKSRNHWHYEIFTGALDEPAQLYNADKGKYQTLIKTIINTTLAQRAVAGIDLHLHVDSVMHAEEDIEFIKRAKSGRGMPFNKQIIATEFSLTGLWDEQRTAPLVNCASTNFPLLTLLTWTNDLIEQAEQGTPITQEAFAKCISGQSWYPTNPDWFTEMFDMFCKEGVSVATYGLEQTIDVPPLLYPDTEHTTAHLFDLNAVYNCVLLGPAADGYCNTNPLVFADFQAALRNGCTGTSAVER